MLHVLFKSYRETRQGWFRTVTQGTLDPLSPHFVPRSPQPAKFWTSDKIILSPLLKIQVGGENALLINFAKDLFKASTWKANTEPGESTAACTWSRFDPRHHMISPAVLGTSLEAPQHHQSGPKKDCSLRYLQVTSNQGENQPTVVSMGLLSTNWEFPRNNIHLKSE